MPRKRATSGKIIWAVDAFAEKGTQDSAARLVRMLSSKTSSSVEPVHILRPSGFATAGRESILFFLPRAERALEGLGKEFGFQRMEPFKILAQKSVSTRAAVKGLLSYAANRKAASVAVSTNAKRGFARMVLGSFAETLILQSRIPVFIVKPTTKIGESLSPILFPTDFSNSSWIAFQQVVRLARTLRAKITCFHQFQCEDSAVQSNVLYAGRRGWRCADAELTEEIQLENQVKFQKWKNWAEKNGARCNSLFHFGVRNAADASISASKEIKAGMIALAATTGPVATALIGSNSRYIVRSADCPVWVLYVPHK